MSGIGEAGAVLDFWFNELEPDDWWRGEPAIDEQVIHRFKAAHDRLSLGEGVAWRRDAGGRLAEIIVLDQFSRQIYRNQAAAFAHDGMAIVLAQEAVAQGCDKGVPEDRRSFFYMPFMHAESLVIQQSAQPLFAALGADMLAFASSHLETIRRFGRFPKRNAALGRASTPAEIDYMAETGKRVF